MTNCAPLRPTSRRGLKAESFRRRMAVVPQDIVLFNDTIFYNIHYGNMEATEEDVYRAAR